MKAQNEEVVYFLLQESYDHKSQKIKKFSREFFFVANELLDDQIIEELKKKLGKNNFEEKGSEVAYKSPGKFIKNERQSKKVTIFEEENERNSSPLILQNTPNRVKNNSITEKIKINRTSFKKFTIHRYKEEVPKIIENTPNTIKKNSPPHFKSNSRQDEMVISSPPKYHLLYSMKQYNLKSIKKLKDKYFDSKKHKRIKNIIKEEASITKKTPKIGRNEIIQNRTIGPKSHVEYLERSNSRIKGSENHRTEPFKNQNNSLKDYQKYRDLLKTRLNHVKNSKSKPKVNKSERTSTINSFDSKYLNLLRNGRQMFKINSLNSQPMGDISPIVSPSITEIGLKHDGRETTNNVEVSEFRALPLKTHTPHLVFEKHRRTGRVNFRY